MQNDREKFKTEFIKSQADELLSEAEEISSILGSSILTMKIKRNNNFSF